MTLLLATLLLCSLMQGGLGRSCKAADVDRKMSDNTVNNAYYSYRVCHEILKEHPKYDPMDVLIKNGERECEKACRKDISLNGKKRCSGWYFLQSGGSGGACFQCYLYKKNTYEVLSDKEIQGPVCPRSYCRVGICKS
jgi:hypothetical protein